MTRWLAAASAVLLVGAGLAYAFLQSRLTAVDPAGSAQVFVVERGSGLIQIANDLEAVGLLRDARIAAWAARLRGLAPRMRAGEYELSPHSSAIEIFEHIASGRVKTHPIVVPEGLRASEIAQRLEDAGLIDADEFLAVAFDPTVPEELGVQGHSLEGYLYPETYLLPRGLAAREIARQFVDEFLDVWSEIEPQARAQHLSMAETVTLASIVEKETGAPEERAVIAAVFRNRMERRMRLETDPTVIYGIPDFDGNLTKQHLLDKSNPYNTYRIPGLPPGPIASPGREALQAVVEPAESDYLYFVARGDGTHEFSKAYREHVNAVKRYQLRKRKR